MSLNIEINKINYEQTQKTLPESAPKNLLTTKIAALRAEIQAIQKKDLTPMSEQGAFSAPPA